MEPDRIRDIFTGKFLGFSPPDRNSSHAPNNPINWLLSIQDGSENIIYGGGITKRGDDCIFSLSGKVLSSENGSHIFYLEKRYEHMNLLITFEGIATEANGAVMLNGAWRNTKYGTSGTFQAEKVNFKPVQEVLSTEGEDLSGLIDSVPVSVKDLGLEELKVIQEKLYVAAQNVGEQIHQIKSSMGDGNCCICLDKPANTLCLPCKHLCLCNYDSKMIDRCPICRTMITEKMEIYL
eukprot:TRINITY_DN9942_c0_g1_i1.p1 TRINITY_DN9942_c0_g1~~TRINITY_DN9942_c0_g1_i1.p1  ORF type:complete len:244 (+),score=34.14 TRINITY_DN9942_c0_g1_i1:25-732(+)